MVEYRKTGSQQVDANALLEAAKGSDDVRMDYVHSLEMSVSVPSLEGVTAPLEKFNRVFQFPFLGHKIDTKIASLANILDTSTHFIVDNVVGTNDMTLAPFDGGIKATLLDQDSMALVLHESVSAADDEGHWIVASSKNSWR